MITYSINHAAAAAHALAAAQAIDDDNLRRADLHIARLLGFRPIQLGADWYITAAPLDDPRALADYAQPLPRYTSDLHAAAQLWQHLPAVIPSDSTDPLYISRTFIAHYNKQAGS